MLVPISIIDYVIALAYILIVLLVGYIFSNRFDDQEDVKYFRWGLLLKVVGALGIVWLYAYYYNRGDSLYYFMRSERILSYVFYSPSDFFSLIIGKPNPATNYEAYMIFMSNSGEKASNYTPVRFGAFFNIFTLNSYPATSVLFAACSYVGIWQFYRLFTEVTNLPKKQIALAFLFIPSVFFWGSGMLKDSITIGFLGLFLYTSYRVVIQQRFRPLYLVVFILSAYMVGVTKTYVLMAGFPAILIWKAFDFKERVNSAFLKSIIFPVTLGLSLLGGIIILQQMSSLFERYSIDNVLEQAEKMQRWHTYRVEVQLEGDGSSYSLGNVSFTPAGLVRSAPAAINVALFRPYLWEANNPIVLLSALESTAIFLLFLRLFFQNPLRVIRQSFSDPITSFCLLFSLIFAFAVGFTSYNFGALSRYRIPMLPFFVLFLFLLYSKSSFNKNQLPDNVRD